MKRSIKKEAVIPNIRPPEVRDCGSQKYLKSNIAKGKGKKGNQIIHLKDCFHGRSGYTMSLTDSPDPRKVQYFPKFDWPRINNPKINIIYEGAFLFFQTFKWCCNS